MNLEKKQLTDKNRAAFFAGLLIECSLTITAIVALVTGRNGAAAVARLIVGIAAIAVNGVTIGKLKDSVIYRHVCSSSMILVFLTALFTADVPYIYAYVFPIAILVMIYADAKLSIAGALVASIATIVYEIVSLNRQFVDIEELVFEISMVLIACVLALIITVMLRIHGKENMEAVEEQAQKQTKTAEKIIDLAEQLNQKFESAKDVSESLNDTMKTSHDAVSEIAESTHMNAEAINQQTSQTSGIQESIESVGQEARNMGEISERTNSNVASGVDMIEQLKNQAAQVAQINKETGVTTQQLNDSIKDVEAITDTILGISDQTNLLALNASIEAARAGEAGKGFAVVADEIRKLSEDTRKATEEISQIIEKLIKDADNAAQSMTKSSEYAEKQNELISETGAKLSDIKKDTDALYKGVHEVNASVDSIISANSIIMDSITNLSATGEEVAASTDTALSISDSAVSTLKDMNHLLYEIHEISDQMENIVDNK